MGQGNDDKATARALKAIRNARSRLIVCFLTFPLYVIVISALVREGRDVTSLMLLYMLLYAGFGINAAVRRCPRCHEPFYVRSLFLNIFRRHCAHCGLPSDEKEADQA